MRLLPVLLLALACPPLLAADDAAAPPRPASFVPAHIAPNQSFRNFYPGYPDREALVYVRFNLSASGEASDVEALEGGFHNKRFRDAALRMVPRTRFIPAMRNGVPIDTPGLVLPVRFRIDVNKGVMPEFRSEVRKVVRLVEDKDFAGAHFHAEWMLAEKVTLNFEYALLKMTYAHTLARMGETHRALVASREATARSGMTLEEYVPGSALPRVSESDFTLNKEALASGLMLRFLLAASQGFLLDAAKAHADLQALKLVGSDDPSMSQFRQVIERLQTSAFLVAQARVDETGHWDHEPLLRTFSADEVKDGALDAIDIDCAGRSSTLPWASDVEWRIPPAWNGCRLRFHGSPGTRFRIVEIRNPVAAAP